MVLKHLLIGILFLTTINVHSQTRVKLPDSRDTERIAPDNCLVRAKIVKVVPRWKKKSKQLCKVSPCLVYINIIKVEQYGSSFPEHFSAGQKVEVSFVYSLKPSKKVYPDKNIDLPGLKKGDVFKAKINAKPQLGSNLSVFKIYDYQKL
jgi:hypothetical protein